MTVHKPVLINEVIESLGLKNGDTVVDATLGGGGYSREIARKIGNDGFLIAIDLDIEAINRFAELPITNFQLPKKYQIPNTKYKIQGNICLVNDNFANLKNILIDLGIEEVDAVVADLGISSDQLDSAERGFSFTADSELDMRLNQEQELSAKEIVNKYSKEELEKIFRDYGDEKYARRISEAIEKTRKERIIQTTKDLVFIIEKAVPGSYKHQKIHFATRVFQALRIETNNELENLKKFIPNAIEILKKGGRMAVVTFHSGEDRIVKNIFRENARGCICPKEFPVCRCNQKPKVKIITKKPISPGLAEREENPRARSAKLRVVEKI